MTVRIALDRYYKQFREMTAKIDLPCIGGIIAVVMLERDRREGEVKKDEYAKEL